MNREQFMKLDTKGKEDFKRKLVEKTIAEQRANMDEATKEKHRLFDLVKNPENSKYPTIPFVTKNEKEADDMVNAIIYFVGGATRSHKGDEITITSEGYYHYIGA